MMENDWALLHRDKKLSQLLVCKLRKYSDYHKLVPPGRTSVSKQTLILLIESHITKSLATDELHRHGKAPAREDLVTDNESGEDQSDEDVLDIVEDDKCQDTDESDESEEVEIGCDSSDESHGCTCANLWQQDGISLWSSLAQFLAVQICRLLLSNLLQ